MRVRSEVSTFVVALAVAAACVETRGQAMGGGGPAITVAAPAVEVPAAPAGAGAPSKEPASLEGVWTVVSMETDGERVPQEHAGGLRFCFAGKDLEIRLLDDPVAKSTFELDTSENPPQIRLTYMGEPTLGIYQLEGDALSICLGRTVDDPPTDFATGPDVAGAVLFRLERGDKRPQAAPLLIVNADGTNVRKLDGMPVDLQAGSPDWSPNGKYLAFDGWRLARGETYGNAHVYVVGVDGKGLKDLGPGAMPSWSPDSKRLVFCKYGGGMGDDRGVWIMDADGQNQKHISPDGWGCDWSPKGDEIVFTLGSGLANLCVYDTVKDESRMLLDSQEYASIYWNLSWSADGKQIAFKGNRTDGSQEIAVVDARGEQQGFKILVSTEKDKGFKQLSHIVAWDGDQNRILSPMRGSEDKLLQIYVLDPTGAKPPQRFPGLDPSRINREMAWSPDGKQIVFISQEKKPPQPPAGALALPPAQLE
ncbi:MAG: TIGR03067 domain-containing protein [Planctomycetota bacterium]